MRVTSIAAACSAALIGIAASSAWADAVKATPELTVFNNEQTSPGNAEPIVLRGSATRRGTVDTKAGDLSDLSRFAFGAGDKLWLTDPISGEVIVCDERRTSRVGSRFVGCVRDQLPPEIYK